MAYTKKNEIQLTWLENKDQLRLDLRHMLRRVENNIMDELQKQFNEGISRGELLKLRRGPEELTKLMKQTVRSLSE